MDERVQKYEQKMTKTLNGFEEELIMAARHHFSRLRTLLYRKQE